MARDLFAEVTGGGRDLFAEVMADQPTPEQKAQAKSDWTLRENPLNPSAGERMNQSVRDGTPYVSDHAPEDDWGTVARKTWDSLGPAFRQSIGGAIQGLVEAGAAQGIDGQAVPYGAPVTSAEIGGEALEAPKTFVDMGKRGAVPGQDIYAAATRDLEANAINPGDSAAKKYLPMIAQSVVQMVPAIAATVATGNPEIGAAIMGGQVGGQQYGESRADGRDPRAATVDAAFMAGAEMIGETIPLSMMMKPGGSFMKDALKTAGAEGLQEIFTQTLQTGYDMGVLKPDMTWGEARRQLIDAGIVGFATGGAMHTLATPFRGSETAPLSQQPLTPQEDALLTPGDRTSPIPDKLIARGKALVDGASNPAIHPGNETAQPPAQPQISPATEGGPFDALFAELEQGQVFGQPVGAPIPTPRANEDRQPLRLPVEGPITSRFGHRDQPKAGASTEHGGIDIAVPVGTPVAAPGAGTVIAVGSDAKSGNFVRIDHGDGRVTGYAHLSRADVKVGDTVAAGQEIALSGATGNVTGPHLHYTVRENGAAVDPEKVSFDGSAQLPENPVIDRQVTENAPQLSAENATSDAPITFSSIDETEAREPVFDEADPERQVGWLDPQTGKLAPLQVEKVSVEEQKPSVEPEEVEVDRPSETVKTDGDGWARFDQSSGTKSIPRAEMPQIKAEHRGAMVNFLNARGISHAEETIPAADLKPTQAEFSPEKVRKAREFEGGDRAILVSSDGHILDGHHQWLAAKDAEQDVRAIRLDAPIDKLLQVVPEMPSATADGGADPSLNQERTESDNSVFRKDVEPDISEPAFQASSPIADSGRGATEQSDATPAPSPKLSIDDEKSAISLTGDELGKMPTTPGKGRMLVMRERAKKWYRENLVGTTVDAADGRKVSFNSRGMEKTTRGGDRLMRAVPAIPDIIRNGKVIETRPGDGRGTKVMHLYAATVDIGGEKMRVGAFVRETPDGNLHYSLHEVSGPEATAEAAGDGGKASITPAMEGDAGSNLNLFLLDRDGKDAPGGLDAVKDDLLARLKKYGLADRIALDVVDSIIGMPQAAGLYQYKMITVAMSDTPTATGVLDHEVIHALRDLGVFKPHEWRALEAAARADKAIMASVKRRYSETLGDDPDAMMEEAIGDLFAKYNGNAIEPKGFVRVAIEKLRTIFRAIREAFTGAGYTDANAVLEAINAGEIGEGRGNQNDRVRVTKAPKLSIPATGLPSPLGRDASTPDDTVAAQSEERAQRFVDSQRGTGDRDPRAESAFDRWRTALQDRMLPVLRLQQAVEKTLGKSLAESQRPYHTEELMTGKIGARSERLVSDMVEPLFDSMREAGVSVDELESYLYARHAPERNKRIAEINPEIPEGGSGMTDEEAAEIMAAVERDPRRDAVKALAAQVDAILKYAVDTRVEGGLLSQSDADLWAKTYGHYVPLRGKAELDPEANADRPMKGGSGITVKGKESRRAFGRKSRASDILAYSILQAEEAIMRAETNAVGQAFHALAKEAPDADFWQVNKISRKAVWDSSKGQVEYRSESRISAEDAPYTVSLKIDGTEHRVTLNRDNPAAVRVADAMRNLSAQQLNQFVKYLGAFTRLFSRINTTWNPEFTITNAFRDIQTAGVNLQQHDVPGLVRHIVRDWRKALTAPSKGDGEWAKWRREFELSGGKVYFNDLSDLNSIKGRIDRAMAGKGVSLKAGALKFMETVDKVNDRVENAVRLAAYKNAREAGMSKSQAASLARNATVNFTRRGQYGPVINSLYAFFNASVQGSATLMIAAGRSRKVRGALVGAVALGFMLDMLNRWSSDDDDDGESYWSKIPAFEKQRNLILMVPGWKDETIKIPVGLGLHAFVSLGRNLSEMMHGRSVVDAGAEAVWTALDAFNPLGSNSLLTTLLPTALDPVAELATNQDFTGKPIVPEPSPFDPPPTPSNNFFPSVSTASREASQFLNRISGGDAVMPGAVSVSPEVLDYLGGFLTGGAGRFVQKVANLASAPFDPERELKADDFPFVRKVVGNKPRWLDKSLYYDRIGQIDQSLEYAKTYAEKGDREGLEALKQDRRHILSMVPLMKAARKEMRSIRKDRGKLTLAHDLDEIDDAKYKAAKAILDEREGKIVAAFNTRWNERMAPKD